MSHTFDPPEVRMKAEVTRVATVTDDYCVLYYRRGDGVTGCNSVSRLSWSARRYWPPASGDLIGVRIVPEIIFEARPR